MKAKSIVVSLLLALSGPLFAQNAELMKKGLLLMDNDQFSSAITYFKGLPKSLEGEFQAEFYIGKAYYQLQRNDSAEFHFAASARLNPKSPLGLIGLGGVDLQKENSAGAEANFTKARKLAKKNLGYYAEIMDLCVKGKVKDFALQASVLNFGTDINSKSPELLMSSGDALFLKQEIGKALSAFEWVAQFQPDNANAFRKIGLIQTSGRDYRNALNAFAKAKELDPNQILLYKNLSDLQFLLGKYPEALESYQTYMSRAAVTVDDKERFALLLFFNKKYNESASELDEVIKVNPNSPVLFRVRGYIAYEMGEYDKGVQLMNKFFELQSPEKILTSDFAYMGKLQAKIKNDSLAISNLVKAVQMDSTKNETIEELSRLYSFNHKHQEAISCILLMRSNGMDQVNTLFSIGKEYFFMGSYYKSASDSLKKVTPNVQPDPRIKIAFLKADSCFTELTKLKPNYIGGFLWKGRSLAYMEQNPTDGLAKASYEQAATILEAGDLLKNKKTLIECYRYLGSYYYFTYENNTKADNAKSNKELAVQNMEKILKLDPSDSNAKESLSQLKK